MNVQQTCVSMNNDEPDHWMNDAVTSVDDLGRQQQQRVPRQRRCNDTHHSWINDINGLDMLHRQEGPETAQ